jgi:protein phosphatase
MTRTLRLASAGETHAGKIRADNEDRFAIFDHLGLFLVADGMGGCPAGEIAATLAIDTVRAFFEDSNRTTPDSPESLLACLIDAAQEANRRILAEAAQHPKQRGMGTTFAGMLVQGAELCIAHAGDSRVYRLRDQQLDLLTEDHTLLNECLWHGMPVDQAEAMPNRYALTRALGVHRNIELSARLEGVKPGDLILICTDGISKVLARQEIAALLAEAGELGATARRFIARANDAGGPDNATAVLLRWTL